eukprot:TRINITY_DN217_c3_g2_i1.p2 TRINITY_DN217_c3_g2~~TRINITY_DN217_c3_g2_i1.p2  ORF type:complete len:127 (-),score=25.39 TRINITY_DN217_c3_g2_i1:182-562(-)
MRVRRSVSNRCGELVMNPVDLLIPPLAVEEPMDPVIQIVLDQKIHQQLEEDLPSRRKRQSRPNPKQLDSGVGAELERADDEDEHEHDVSVAFEDCMGRETNFRLELVFGEGFGVVDIDESEGERSD